MTTNPTARRLATIEGWLTEPNPSTATPRGQPSEGHTSAVRVLRMVNSHQQHTAAEPVPFCAKRPAALRSTTPTPQPKGCAGNGGACISHPDCPDVQCEGHPDNMGAEAHAPTAAADPATRAAFWRAYIAVIVVAMVLASAFVWGQ